MQLGCDPGAQVVKVYAGSLTPTVVGYFALDKIQGLEVAGSANTWHVLATTNGSVSQVPRLTPYYSTEAEARTKLDSLASLLGVMDVAA